MDNKKHKRIGIDARFYGPVGKGLGRYTQEVVDNLLNIDGYNEYVIFLCKENFDSFKTNNPRARKVLADVRWYTMLEQILMPYYIWREKIDLMHFHHFNVPLFCPTKFVVTIHDLILIKFPSLRATKLSPLLYKIKNKAYRLSLDLAIKKSKKIIAVSEFTKKDILENFSIDSDKVIVTLEGVSQRLIEGESAPENIIKTLDKYKIEKPYLLYVGNAYPHKNLEWLMDVYYRELGDLKIDLVLVGKEDYFFKRLKEIKLKNEPNGSDGKKTIFPGYVPDDELQYLFQGAMAYVFPSKYEGFGIPPLEAMANDCPVISSNAASMPEVLGDAVKYFNPENREELVELIKIIFNNPAIREGLVEKGREQIKKYSWVSCAEETKEVLDML
ncbi:MAG: glycosyltransferase family 1 protein [Patescibacteria group bacterium]|jgi:glycosyltransferase involved in cell wall biosynthesis|nr:glycosyltransferase family 1 protein [Patescibacteria group bacterium]